MKKFIAVALLGSAMLMATDYTTYSAEELAAMRGSIPAEEQADFQAALQSALADLSAEERQAIMSKKGNKAQSALSTRSQTRTRTRTRANNAMGALDGTGAGGNGNGGGMQGAAGGKGGAGGHGGGGNGPSR